MNKEKIMRMFEEIPTDKTEKKAYFLTLEPTDDNLEFLIQYSLGKIQETLEEIEIRQLDVRPVVSLSGRDSIVMLDLCRRLKPDIAHMFSNTGLEGPSHIKFWKENYPDLEWVTARKTQIRAYENHGSPIVSKNISSMIYRVVNSREPKQDIPITLLTTLGLIKPGFTKDNSRRFRLSKKGLFLLDRDEFPNKYKYSAKCCDIFKGRLKHANKKGAFVGTRVEESMNRGTAWRKTGCINYNSNMTTPLSLGPHGAIVRYVFKYNLKLPDTYTVLGLDRTGCYSCPFGLIPQQRHDDKHNLNLLYEHYPSVYKHTMDKVGLKRTYQYMNIEVHTDEQYMIGLEEINKRKVEGYKNLAYNYSKICVRYTHNKKGFRFTREQAYEVAYVYSLNKFEFGYGIKYGTNYYTNGMGSTI